MNISCVQKSIWITKNVFFESALYNVSGYAHIKGVFSEDILITAIQSILNGVDAIDSGYAAFNELELENNPRFKRIELINLDFSNDAHPDQACKDCMVADIRKQLAISQNLLKVVLLRASIDTLYWYTKAHHLVFDGYAMSLFFNKV